jgi:hypothetical protein
MVRRQKGGFQKRINADFNALTRHPTDCGACMVNYFGGDRDFTEELYSSSIDTGLELDIIFDHVSGRIKENERLQGRNPDDISCSWKPYPDGYSWAARSGGWTIHEDFIKELEMYYNTVLPGYNSMVALHPPSGMGHFVTMGKEKDGTEILYCPQTAKYVRGPSEIVHYFYHLFPQGIHAFSVLLCETSNGTQYVEGRGSLGRGAHAGPGDMPRTKSEADSFYQEGVRRSMQQSHRGGGTRKNRKNMSKKKKSYRGGGNKKNTKRKSRRSK